jgi:hypothetical protein
MKFQIMSDAHMQVDSGFGDEYEKFNFPIAAPNLVLLGGMGRICDKKLGDFIILQLTRYDRVFYVMGKDEFHRSTVVSFWWFIMFVACSVVWGFQQAARQSMQSFAARLVENPPAKTANGETLTKLGTFHYLHRTRVDVEDITILGCTLWRGLVPSARQPAGFRSIKDFSYEDELKERDLDLVWLQSQLDECTNSEVDVSSAGADGNVVNATLDRAPIEEEGDIYNDVEMSSPSRPAKIIAEEPSSESPQVAEGQPRKVADFPDTPTACTMLRQGPRRRVVIFTSYPPTYNKTTHPKWVPSDQSSHNVELILQDRQCWGPEGGVGNGVTVDSPVHGNGTKGLAVPTETDKEVKQAELDQADAGIAETSPCNDNIGATGDMRRPPGVAAWAFGYSRWSCDVQYNVGVTKLPHRISDPKGKRKRIVERAPEEGCPLCGCVPAPIRMVSNQRGQQWERNPEPYVDVPHTWRAFDDAFVIDV